MKTPKLDALKTIAHNTGGVPSSDSGVVYRSELKRALQLVAAAIVESSTNTNEKPTNQGAKDNG